jgi:hypothetical protein
VACEVGTQQGHHMTRTPELTSSKYLGLASSQHKVRQETRDKTSASCLEGGSGRVLRTPYWYCHLDLRVPRVLRVALRFPASRHQLGRSWIND